MTPSIGLEPFLDMHLQSRSCAYEFQGPPDDYSRAPRNSAVRGRGTIAQLWTPVADLASKPMGTLSWLPYLVLIKRTLSFVFP